MPVNKTFKLFFAQPGVTVAYNGLAYTLTQATTYYSNNFSGTYDGNKKQSIKIRVVDVNNAAYPGAGVYFDNENYPDTFRDDGLLEEYNYTRYTGETTFTVHAGTFFFYTLR